MTGAAGRRSGAAPRLQPAGAQEVLGADHPLARAQQRVRWLGRQAATLGALLPVGGLALIAGAPGLGTVLAAGALVEAWLLVALSIALSAMRESTLDLIAEGHGSLPLAFVRRRRAQLVCPRHVGRLAEAIEVLRREARCPYRGRPMARPVYVPAVIRAMDAELAATIRVLRAEPDAATVACVERLLGGASSPLYGDDARHLREELTRIHLRAALR